MLPVIHGVCLGCVRKVTVGTTSSIHFLMKPLTDMVNSLMLLEESVLAMQSCSLASASSDYFRIERTGTSCYFMFEFLFLSRNQEDRVMVKFAKRSG